MTRDREHIAYVDGLRGLAIALVVLSHAWNFSLVNTVRSEGYRTFLDHLFWHGYEGVSLFLVLSGFCLAIGPLQKRQAGRSEWFRPAQFFGRRAWRILPPYYAALALYVVVDAVYARERWQPLFAIGRYPLWSSIVSHAVLVHNLTHARGDFNNSFWSLGLEWQWYLVFPAALVWCLVRPRAALAACLGLAVLWALVTQRPQAVPDTSSCMLPARLFEFCCGVVVAQLVVQGRRLPLWSLLAALTPPLFLALAIPTWPDLSLLRHAQDLVRDTLGLTQPLYGLTFGALILLGAQSGRVCAALSWRPLVWLGTVSYSIYLIHEPLIEAIDTYGLRWIAAPGLLASLAAVAAVGTGALFYHLVERPCMAPRSRAWAEPRIARLLPWTDALWDTVQRRLAPTRPRPAPGEEPAPGPLTAH